MGKLKENMLQSLRFDRETKTWLTKHWKLKPPVLGHRLRKQGRN